MKESNVQRIIVMNKEAEDSANQKVMLTGNELKGAMSNSRYMPIFLLFKTMENNLTEDVNFNVNVSYLTLEAMHKALVEIGNYEDFVSLFEKNIEPLNFFRLINDLGRQGKYRSGRQVSNIFFTSATTLKKLNSFYNEYNDIYDYCIIYKYTLLYLFSMSDKELPTMLKSFDNLRKYFQDNDENNFQKRHIVSCLFNELENEVNRCGVTESTKDEFYHKMQKINDNIEKLFRTKDLNALYSIDALYYSL